jgi:hypothetical protein
MTKKTAAVLSGLLIAGAITVRLKPDTTYDALYAQAPSPYDLVILNCRII